MFKYFILLFVSLVCVSCQTKNITSKVLTNENATNATKLLVLEFVNGMGRALQQLLTANTINSRQSIDSNSTAKQENYRIEGEKLREEIIKRVNQLQTLIGTAIQVSKERRDVVSKRILEQTNARLEGAKERADKILREPNNSEIAVRTLRTIDSGINQLSSFVNTVLGKINISINVNVKDNRENIDYKNTTNTTNTQNPI